MLLKGYRQTQLQISVLEKNNAKAVYSTEVLRSAAPVIFHNDQSLCCAKQWIKQGFVILDLVQIMNALIQLMHFTGYLSSVQEGQLFLKGMHMKPGSQQSTEVHNRDEKKDPDTAWDTSCEEEAAPHARD